MRGIEGSTLGRYELRQRIATGGMSEVYLGYDRRVRRYVAVKVLYASADAFVRRFEREAVAVGTLSHEHILPLYDFGEQRPWYYLVMPYIEGGTLRDYLFKRERLTLEEAGSILEQIASALQHAHQHGVVHRDVKPSNILLRPDGYAYLVDFGLAKAKMEAEALTHDGAMIGTPEYMAPEQSNGKHDYRSDIYSLGVILYQMLTGRVPFTAESPVAISLKHIQLTPPAPTQFNEAITPAVEAVILKAMAKDPEERYQDTSEFAEAYITALHQKDIPATPKPKETLQVQAAEIAANNKKLQESTPLLPLFPLTHPLSPLPIIHAPTRAYQTRSFTQRVLIILGLCLLLASTMLALFWQTQARAVLIIQPSRIPSSTPTSTSNTQWLPETTTAQAQATQQAILVSQAQAQSTAGITNTLGVGPVLYSDTMTTRGGGWIDDQYQCYFSPPGYHVHTSQIHTAAWCYTNTRRFSNAIITAQAQLVYGDTYGLILRLTPASKDFYVFELDSHGDYRFVRAQGSNPLNWLTLIDWTYSTAIASGYGQTNTFLIIATGTQFRFYINKQLVIASFSDAAYSTGLIGFFVSSDNKRGTDAVFSNLWVFQHTQD